MSTQPAPDGAKPGAEQAVSTDKFAFDADARAKRREDAPITIGEHIFHRRRKSWEVTRELRRLLRLQERSENRGERLRARVEAMTEQIRGVRDENGGWKKPPIEDDAEAEKIEQQVADLEPQIDEATDEGDEAAYRMISLLLCDEAGAQPTLDHLKEHLDMTEAGALAGALASGTESVEDPTTTPTESSSVS